MRVVKYLSSNSLLRLLLLFVSLFLMSVASLNLYIDSKLPDENKIRDIDLQIPLKIFTADKKLIGEFGEKWHTRVDSNH